MSSQASPMTVRKFSKRSLSAVISGSRCSPIPNPRSSTATNCAIRNIHRAIGPMGCHGRSFLFSTTPALSAPNYTRRPTRSVHRPNSWSRRWIRSLKADRLLIPADLCRLDLEQHAHFAWLRERIFVLTEIFLGHFIDVLRGAFLGDARDPTANLDVAVRIVRVGDGDGDRR